ncbi:MAG: VCBS domain-containing protein [Piscinibacter sp.]|nr:VCBS domain-containing protein [Piscinibacter sp.]
MPTIAQAAQGIVSALWGHAVIRGADGKMRVLKVGDLVKRGDVILTTQEGIVQITPEEAPARAEAKPAEGESELDRVITELNQGDQRSAPAAGLSGGGDGSLQEGLRVDRIAEGIDGASASFGSEPVAASEVPPSAGGSDEPPADDTTPPAPELVASSSSIGAVEEGAPTNLGLQAPTGTQSGTTIVVTDVPAVGEIHKADGTLVTPGMSLTAAELEGLVYVPPADYAPGTSVGEFTYQVTSGDQTASGSATIAVSAVNDVPLASGGSATGAEDALLPIALGGSDVDGTIVGITVTDIPAGSMLLLADGVTSVAVGQVLTPEQAGHLLFQPAPDFNGGTAVTFTVTDDAGAVSAPASIGILVTAVNDAPVVTGETAQAIGSAPITIDVLANDRDPDGDPLGVASATVDPALGSVSVNPDGSLTFSAAPGVTGPVTVTYTVTDGAGGSATASVLITVAPGPTVSVDAPALTSDATPTLTGTTNLPAGSSVTLTVTDATGAVQVLTAGVAAGGIFAIDVPAALAEGPYSVVAAVTDSAGNTANATDAGAIDLTAPALTVDAPALTNDPTPTITGTTDLPAGSTVTLVVTDSAGAVQTLAATVAAGGTYAIDVPSALPEGNYTVVASASDAAGNVGTANDSGAIDLTAPTLTVDAPALTNDSTPTITGTTNLPAGSTVTLVVTDSAGTVQTLTTTVAAGGTYSVDVPSALAEGNFSVLASTSDAAGNAATADDSGAIDLTAPTLTVDAPALTNDATPTITGTTDLPAGSTVTLVITDSAGGVQTLAATVVAGGTYSVDVPIALAEGNFAVLASASDAAGNAATANDSGAIDLTAPSLTVDAPALTNDSTPTITGSTNLPAGSTVTLVVTDSAGAVQTLTATVAAGGTFAIDVPSALAEGDYSVVASASDAAGNAATANDSGAIDLTAPSLTVDAPALTNDSTPTITGTTDLPAGSTVTLVVTDSAGTVQTLTTMVAASGSYAIDVPSALAEGSYTVAASATDAAGNAVTADDNGAIDLTAPSLTVDAPALTNDSTPTITGTTDLPVGSTVTLVVADSAGAVQTLAAAVTSGGTYSVDVPVALAEGNYTVAASATDAAGNAATANDTGAIDLTAPTLTVDAPALTNDSTPTITGTTDLPAGSTVTLVVTDSAGAVQTLTTSVTVGGTYSIDVASALAEGSYAVVASASDSVGNAATANDSGAVDLTAPSLTVDAPALTNDSTPTITGTTDLPAGSTVTLVVTDSAGAAQTVTATVAAGGTYAVDVPSALAEGNYTVVASATDAAGNAATANDNGAVDLTAPTLTVDAPALTSDSTPTLTGTTNLPAGSLVTLVVTDSAGAAQTFTVTAAAGGTFAVDVPSALAEGNYTVVASASDEAGNTATANDNGAIDLTAPTLTVDAPALTGDSTPTISGSTDLPAGSVVTLVVTDAAGAVQTLTAAVAAGGTYAVDVPSALAEGNYAVVASAYDAAGNLATANDSGAVDLTAPTLTVDAPALSNDATPTISGTTDLPAGSPVTLVITDSAGSVQTLTATALAGGTYVIDVPSALAEGSYSVVASATDAAGNTAMANDSGAIDLTGPTLTVDAPALTIDSTPTITGTTDLPAGSTVTLVVTDSAGAVQTLTANVAAGGTYGIDVPSALAEGSYTVVASASDAAGNAATANDTGAVDLTAPSLTVDAPALTNDSTPTITGTTDLPAGSTVTLVVTDSAGAVQTLAATVAAGGTYAIDVPSALAEGNYTVVASASDAAGNAASANDSGAVDLTAPALTVDAPALTNDSTPTIVGTTNLPAGSTVALVVTDSAGSVQTLAATVAAGGTYTVDVPSALAEGSYTVVASASDGAGNAATANDSGAIDLTAPALTVDAPALTNDSTPTITGTTDLPAGSTVTLVVTDSAGAVQTLAATVTAGGMYGIDVPSALAEGNYTVFASASDAAGNSAAANDTGAIDLTAPSLTVDAPALTNDPTPTITGTTDLPAGSPVTLVVTDSAGGVQTLTAIVVAGGTYAIEVPSTLAEGSYSVVASATDAAGNAVTANDAGAIDLTAPTLTVDAPALTNDPTPTITGTTDLPVGSIVTLIVTDSAGAAQTLAATVTAGGTYSIDVPSALAEGNYTVVASASDAAGNGATASDNGAIDLTAPALTVDAPALTNDSTPTITGTSNLPTGSTVTLVVTDSTGAVQTLAATVAAGGTYSVEIPIALAEGNFTVLASASDAAGNAATANDTGAIDLTAPSLTVDAPALTNDSTPTISGTTDLPVASTVTLVVTDSAGAVQTLTATVAAGGTYAIDVPSALAEGNFTVTASASDAAGNAATANDSGAVDLTAPSLTVDAPALTNDATPTITGTTDLPAGSTVTLVVTDSVGAVQTVTATVAAGGTYAIDVPSALAEGNYVVAASALDAAGNAATASDSGAIDLTAPALTVDAPALTNDSTPTITGTTDLPAGSTVTLVVTDAAGAVQTLAATVAAGGTYAVDVPSALAEGNYTVVASASDAAGNAATANDNGAVDLTAPTLTVDAPALTNDPTPTITGTTDLPVGSDVTLVITDSAGSVQTLTATVIAGGTYAVDVPSALAEGSYSVVASATDAAGNSATANDSGAIDLTAPTLTVDAPALTNDSTPTIAGTTNLPAGSIVTLVVTDSAGAVQTLAATVAAGGTYAIDVPSALAEGNYTVVASASDAAGNAATANDNGAVDLTAPTLTVDAPALTKDATPTITGTTDLPPGSTVTLVVTDAAGVVQTLAATVAAGGTYTIDVPAALAEGSYTVAASATDAAGNTAIANDSGAIDLTAPAVSLVLDPVTADNVLSAAEATGNVQITGTAGGDVRAGDIVTLSIDGADYQAVVGAGGAFAVTVPGAALVADPDHRIDASVTLTDAAGNSATATASQAYAVNTAPDSADQSVATLEDTPFQFDTGHFPYIDADGQPLAAIRIDTLPAAGELRLAGVLVTAGQVIAAADLSSLTFLPAPNENGNDYASFTYSVSDGIDFDAAPNRMTIGVSPVNDPAVVGGQSSGTAVEDAPGPVTGTLTVVDPDAGEAAFQPLNNVAGAHGSFSVDAAGTWTYTLNNADPAVQALGQGQSLPDETFWVATIDGTWTAVTIAITGTNDGPVAVADTRTANEDTAASGNVLANDSDVDSGTSLTVTQFEVGGSTYGAGATANLAGVGMLTIAANGAYTFVPAADYAGPVPVATYTVSDGLATATATLTIALNAQNDAPVNTVPGAVAVLEDVRTAIAGISVADPDESGSVAAQKIATVQISVSNGTLLVSLDAGTSVTAGANGSGTLTLSGTQASLNATLASLAYQGNANYVGGDTLVVVSRDASGLTDSDTIAITVNPVNDAPVAQPDTAIAVEAGGVANGTPGSNPSGNVLDNDQDVDVGDTRSVTAVAGSGAGSVGGSTAGAYGTLTLNADGSYSYVLNNSLGAVQSLRTAADTLTDTFTYTMRDAAGATSTATLTITIQGGNDAPVAVADTASLLENGTVTRTAATGVLINDTDVDAGDTRAVSAVAFGGTPGTLGSGLAGTYGTLTMNADGSYSYSANRPPADALVAGQVVTEAFQVTVRDTAGATSTSTLSFTITGVNDVPTITGTSTGSVREDVTLSASGALTVVDLDAGQSVFNAQTSTGTYGSFSINAAGSWTYTLNNAAANVQALSGTAVVTEQFTVTTADGTPRTVTITVNGTNDAPTAVADVRNTNEDTPVSGNVLANDSDIDSASLAVTQFVIGGNTYAAGATASLAGIGTLTIGANGSYTFTPAANYGGTVPVATYTVSDGSASSTSTLALSITPVADAPTLVINGTTITGGTTTTPGLPASVGLVRQYYDDIGAVSASNAGNIATVEAGVESTSATSTGTVNDVAVTSIGVDDAYRFTGYIHLQAGQTYTIAGYRDDTLMVKIGGTSVYAVGFNNWGNLTGSTFTPTVSGYYTLEVIAYNGDGVGSLDLSMSVNGATAVDLNTTNFRLYPDTSSFSGSVVGALVPNGDGGFYPTSAIGDEDNSIALGTIAASLNDTDGSETLALRVSALPVGATLTDGTRTFTATAGSTSVDVSGWTLGNLRLVPPANYAGTINLAVSATATDSNGSTSTSQGTLPVQVRAVADAPAVIGQSLLVSVAQSSGTAAVLNLPVIATLLDTDGSESLSITISGVPTGATLNHGSSNGSGTWTLAGGDLADLTLTLPTGYATSLSGTTLTVTATSTEASNGETASTSTSLTLFADYATNTPSATTGSDNITGSNSQGDYINALAGNDTINSRGGNDLVHGGDGNDSINGGNGNDMLFGDAGNDVIIGGAGSDVIRGGAGNDTLTGGSGGADGTADVFAWTLADAGSAGAPATDTITDFSAAAVSAGGDVLDLRDLLSGDVVGPGNTAGNLTNFLDFSVSGSGASATTTIHISSSGQFAGGVYAPGQEDQAIVLQGIDLPTALGLASGASDAQIIQELLSRGKLIVDSTP